MIFHSELFAISGDSRKIHSLKSHAYPAQFVLLRIKAPHFGKRGKQGQRVLSAGNSDGYFVAFGYHFIVLARTAGIAENSFGVAHRLNRNASSSEMFSK